jgi:hypothetical protein
MGEEDEILATLKGEGVVVVVVVVVVCCCCCCCCFLGERYHFGDLCVSR